MGSKEYEKKVKQRKKKCSWKTRSQKLNIIIKKIKSKQTNVKESNIIHLIPSPVFFFFFTSQQKMY